ARSRVRREAAPARAGRIRGRSHHRPQGVRRDRLMPSPARNPRPAQPRRLGLLFWAICAVWSLNGTARAAHLTGQVAVPAPIEANATPRNEAVLSSVDEG